MRFNVTLIDPANYKFAYFLTDTCRTIAAGLRSLGHVSDLTVNHIDSASTNIIVGTHLLTPPNATAVIEAGAPYIAFQSEWLYPDADANVCSGFSSGPLQPPLVELFTKAAAVWDCLDSNLPLLQRLGVPKPHIKLYVPGFHEDLVDIQHRPPPERDIDVLFFGSPTPYREQVFDQLRQDLRLMTLFDAPSAFRNDLIARAQINLVLQSGQELSYLPPQRVGYLLNNRCAVLAEAAKEGGLLDDLVLQASRETLVDACKLMLSSPDTEQHVEETFELYRQRPVTAVLERLLD